MTAGTLMLTVQDAVSKWLVEDFHAGEILFFRGLFAYIPIAIFAARAGGWIALRSQRPGVNIVRSLLNTGAGFTVITAYAFMPLADAMAIMFASPFLVAALSVPMLGESVGWRRWSAVMVGFVGVVIILRPGTDSFQWFALLPLAAAGFVAVRDILTRRLGAVDGTTVILFYTVTVSVIAGAMSFPIAGVHWPTMGQWGIFAAMGLLNGVAHYMTIRAFSLAQAATLAPLRYLSLVWAAAIGYVVWNDVPDVAVASGAALVVGSGIFIVLREARLRARDG